MGFVSRPQYLIVQGIFLADNFGPSCAAGVKVLCGRPGSKPITSILDHRWIGAGNTHMCIGQELDCPIDYPIEVMMTNSLQDPKIPESKYRTTLIFDCDEGYQKLCRKPQTTFERYKYSIPNDIEKFLDQEYINAEKIKNKLIKHAEDKEDL